MKQDIKEVVYSYSYIEEKSKTAKFCTPCILQKLPKITLCLPKINLCQNFELSFC